MSQKYRVTRGDFKRMRGFRRLSGKFFALSWGAIPSRHTPGVAVVVSKKVATKATVRNLIKRRARAVLAKTLSPSDTPLVFVCIAKKESRESDFAAIQSDIRALVAKVRAARQAL